MSKLAKALTAAAGNAGGDNLYVEDVFSTFLFTAKSGTTENGDMVNNINLADEGGMVWIKDRTEAYPHSLIDTERGNTKRLKSDSTAAESDTGTYGLLAFNTDGFELGTGGGAMWGRDSGNNEVATWTFRKAEKFFDVVTWVGSNNSATDIGKGIVAHNLGVAPAVVIVKNATQASTNWIVYHKDQTTGYYSILNSTAAQTNSGSVSYFSKNDGGWSQTNPDADNIYIGYNYQTNGNTDTMVAYLFASDAGGFGDDGDESIIKCGSWNENSTNNVTIDCGFEPDFVMFKCADAASSWYMADSMRTVPTPSSGTATGNYIDTILQANSSAAEGSANAISLTSTGFIWYADGRLTNTAKWIYIAIRRPMKTPESGTEVFSPAIGTTDYIGPQFDATFSSVDLILEAFTTSGGFSWVDRVRGDVKRLKSSSTAAEVNSEIPLDMMYGAGDGASVYDRAWMFKRATGFFDVVATTGASGVLTLNHNLGVPPEFLISKRRNGTSHWYADQVVNYLRLNTNGGNLGTPVFNNFTATTFNADAGTFSSGETYITYLFATLDGVSKVGSYTGTGSDLNVDCGFSAGARFILIKRTDSTGDWYVWDSERGIVAGNDPYLLLNSTAAEVTSTDYIDPLSSGFTVTSSAPAALNASGGTYIFLAIA